VISKRINPATSTVGRVRAYFRTQLQRGNRIYYLPYRLPVSRRNVPLKQAALTLAGRMSAPDQFGGSYTQ